jgi:hypothetical protein
MATSLGRSPSIPRSISLEDAVRLPEQLLQEVFMFRKQTKNPASMRHTPRLDILQESQMYAEAGMATIWLMNMSKGGVLFFSTVPYFHGAQVGIPIKDQSFAEVPLLQAEIVRCVPATAEQLRQARITAHQEGYLIGARFTQLSVEQTRVLHAYLAEIVKATSAAPKKKTALAKNRKTVQTSFIKSSLPEWCYVAALFMACVVLFGVVRGKWALTPSVEALALTLGCWWVLGKVLMAVAHSRQQRLLATGDADS